MASPRILIQLDSDPQASTFDAIVAIDAGAEHVLARAGVQVEQVQGLIHGGMFTRSVGNLRNTAVFIGGSDVAAGERLLEAVRQTFFGPFRLSVLLDSNGANTTAAAAVLVLERHLPLAKSRILVLGGTGPVGMRIARLLLQQHACVYLASRDRSRANDACQKVKAKSGGGATEGSVTPVALAEIGSLLDQQGVDAIISAGAAGATLLPEEGWQAAANRGVLRALVDLNAVPPPGIQGVAAQDNATIRHNAVCYGALAVGGLKMKIHRKAVESLFESNDRILDAEEVLELGRQVEAASRK